VLRTQKAKQNEACELQWHGQSASSMLSSFACLDESGGNEEEDDDDEEEEEEEFDEGLTLPLELDLTGKPAGFDVESGWLNA